MKKSILIISFLFTVSLLYGQEINLSDEFFHQLGYRITKSDTEKTAWEEREFKLLNKRAISIKSINQVKGWANTWYRYIIQIESFPTTARAEQRLNRILDLPPDSPLHEDKSFPLREGFVYKTYTVILSTDVYKFYLDPEFKRIFKHVQHKIKKTETSLDIREKSNKQELKDESN